MYLKLRYRLFCRVFLFLIAAASANAAPTWIELASNLKIEKMDDGVYRVVHSLPWAANNLLIAVSDSEFVMVDTPWDNAATKSVVDWLHKNYGDVKLRVINCHYHRDCLGGNGYLLANHIPVYGADLCVTLYNRIGLMRDQAAIEGMKKNHRQAIADAYAASPLRAPDHVFPIHDGLTWTFSQDTVDVFYPGPGHTEDNIVVYSRAHQLLFAGCILKALNQQGIGFTGDAVIEQWPQSIDRLRQRFPNAAIVIPGHGRPGTMELLDHTQHIISRHIEIPK